MKKVIVIPKRVASTEDTSDSSGDNDTSKDASSDTSKDASSVINPPKVIKPIKTIKIIKAAKMTATTTITDGKEESDAVSVPKLPPVVKPIKIIKKTPAKSPSKLPPQAVKSPGKALEAPQTPAVPKVIPIVLKEHQKIWAHDIMRILEKNNIYIDTTSMRGGKSYISSWVGQQLGLKYFVICPPTVKNVWETLRQDYKLDIVEIISYDMIRGKINSEIKHEWLHRTISDKEIDFSITQKYKDLVNEGVLLILDEAHYIKNDSIQFHACRRLIDAVQQSKKSKVALLSATLMTKEACAVQFFSILGYLTSKKLFTYDRTYGSYNYQPLNNLVTKCQAINKAKTDEIVERVGISKSKSVILVCELFTDVVLHTISGSAPVSQTDNNEMFEVRNGFYELVGQENVKLENAISDLEKAIQFVTSQNKKLSRGQIQQFMNNIQVAKVGIFSRLTYKTLNDNPNNKVILALNYTQPITDLCKIFEKYEPLVLTGKTKQKDRPAIIAAFNNDPNKRLLIGNTKVLGLGISLHDKVGNSPRFMFIASDYILTNIHQATGRVFTVDAKSKATVRIVYGGNKCEREAKILETMVNDSIVLRKTLKAENAKDIVLPGEYEKISYIDEDSDSDSDNS